MKFRIRKYRYHLIGLLLSGSVILIGGWWSKKLYDQRRGEQVMKRLLAGDQTVSIQEVSVERLGQELHYTDRKFLNHLAYAIAHYSATPNMGGYDNSGTFYFGDGTVFTTTLSGWGGGFSISLPSEALEEGFPTHDINLPPDAPSDLYNFCAALSTPDPRIH